MSKIVIDESKHRKVPNFFQRLKHAVLAIMAGALFAQVVLFPFGFGSIILWYDSLLFIAYLAVCGILGAMYGEEFIFTVNKETGLFWDPWNYWK